MLFNIDQKELLGALAVLCAFSSTVLYVRSMLRGQTKPHLFSYLVWAIVGSIAAFAQVSDGAGAAVWTTFFSAGTAATIALLSLKYGAKTFTRSDKVALFLALSTIPLWAVTKNPLLSVILACAIDWMGIFPTLRKTWHQPYDETLTAWFFCLGKCSCGLLALSHVSWTTALYPASCLASIVAFLVLCIGRRTVLGLPQIISAPAF